MIMNVHKNAQKFYLNLLYEGYVKFVKEIKLLQQSVSLISVPLFHHLSGLFYFLKVNLLLFLYIFA